MGIMELDLDDLLAAASIASPTSAPASTPVPWSSVAYGPDPDEIRRAQVREAGLYSGRIHRWSRMKARHLWAEWVARFGGDEDLALECAIHSSSAVACRSAWR